MTTLPSAAPLARKLPLSSKASAPTAIPPPAPAAAPRYVVLNSGFTFREEHDVNNALQNRRLPDWAVIDLAVPPDGRDPGRIVAADFFDEAWGVKPSE